MRRGEAPGVSERMPTPACPSSIVSCSSSWAPATTRRPSCSARAGISSAPASCPAASSAAVRRTCSGAGARARSSEMAPDQTTSPVRRTVISSQTSSMATRSWLESSTAVPSAASPRTTRHSSSAPAGSSPLAGSSSSRRRGRRISAAARPSRWRMPSEKPATFSAGRVREPGLGEQAVEIGAAAAVEARQQPQVHARAEIRIEARVIDQARQPALGARGGGRAIAAEHADRTRVGAHEAEHAAQDRALARAVRSHEAVDRAGADLQRHARTASFSP